MLTDPGWQREDHASATDWRDGDGGPTVRGGDPAGRGVRGPGPDEGHGPGGRGAHPRARERGGGPGGAEARDRQARGRAGQGSVADREGRQRMSEVMYSEA